MTKPPVDPDSDPEEGEIITKQVFSHSSGSDESSLESSPNPNQRSRRDQQPYYKETRNNGRKAPSKEYTSFGPVNEQPEREPYRFGKPKYNYEQELKRQIPQSIPLFDKEGQRAAPIMQNKQVTAPSPNFNHAPTNHIPAALPIYLTQQQRPPQTHSSLNPAPQSYINQNIPSYNQPPINQYHNNPQYNNVQNQPPVITQQFQMQNYNTAPQPQPQPYHNPNPNPNYHSGPVNQQYYNKPPNTHPQQSYSNPNNPQYDASRPQYANINSVPHYQQQQQQPSQTIQYNHIPQQRPTNPVSQFPGPQQAPVNNIYNASMVNPAHNTQFYNPNPEPNRGPSNGTYVVHYNHQIYNQNQRPAQLPSYLQNSMHQQPQIINQGPTQPVQQYQAPQIVNPQQYQHSLQSNNALSQQTVYQSPMKPQLMAEQTQTIRYSNPHDYNIQPNYSSVVVNDKSKQEGNRVVQSYYYNNNKDNSSAPQSAVKSNSVNDEENAVVDLTYSNETSTQTTAVKSRSGEDISDDKNEAEAKGSTQADPLIISKQSSADKSPRKANRERMTKVEVKPFIIPLSDDPTSNISQKQSEVQSAPPPPEGKCPDQPKTKMLSFFVDTTPISSVVQSTDDSGKKLESQRKTELGEKQYKIIGQERWFRTQERNLVEKLQKFLVDPQEGKEDKKKKDEKASNDKNSQKKDEAEQVVAEDETVAAEDFNFDSRYFMYNPTQVCNRCKKPGHFEKWCTEEVVIKCLFCLGQHRLEECTQIVCFNCYGVGHRIRECRSQETMICYRCGKRGHRNTQCGVLLPKDKEQLGRDKKDYNISTRCVVCNNYGHANCRNGSLPVLGGGYFDELYVQEDYNEETDQASGSLENLEDLKRRNSSGSFLDLDEIEKSLPAKKIKTSPEDKKIKGE